MSYYANFRFDDGERLALELATVTGLGDFYRWCQSLPKQYKLLHTLAEKGQCAEPEALLTEITAAMKAKRPNPSAKAVADRLLELGIVQGQFAISDEPEDSEFDEEE